jgi:hypothetical protein
MVEWNATTISEKTTTSTNDHFPSASMTSRRRSLRCGESTNGAHHAYSDKTIFTNGHDTLAITMRIVSAYDPVFHSLGIDVKMDACKIMPLLFCEGSFGFTSCRYAATPLAMSDASSSANVPRKYAMTPYRCAAGRFGFLKWLGGHSDSPIARGPSAATDMAPPSSSSGRASACDSSGGRSLPSSSKGFGS